MQDSTRKNFFIRSPNELEGFVLEESITWVNSIKITSNQTEFSIALIKTQNCTAEKATFMKVVKINLANARTPLESVNWLCTLY